MIKYVLGVSCFSLLFAASALAESPDGQPTGKRQHAPATITKPIDKATPAMSEAVDNNEDSDSDDMYEADASSKSADNHEDSDDAMDIKAVHQPGGSATGATRRRGAADNENVDEKTDKSEAARARKKQ